MFNENFDGMNEEEQDDLISQYKTRFLSGNQILSKKLLEIRNSREAFKQIIPDQQIEVATDRNVPRGNSTEEVDDANRSSYLIPLHTALANRWIQDLTTHPFRYEWAGNNKTGVDVQSQFTKEFNKMYSYNNVKSSVATGFWHFVASGTMITQTYTNFETKERIAADGTRSETSKGRVIGIRAYDPLQVILDWNADPANVRRTSEFCIVTLGNYDTEYIKNKYGIEMDTGGNSNVDIHQKAIDDYAGVEKKTSVPVREYYLTDGYKYTIVGDSFVVGKSPNSNGSVGEIPINVAPFHIDPNSPYGSTLYGMIEPSIMMASAAVNQIADNNALNNNMPIFAVGGVLGDSGITLNDFDNNQIVELDMKPSLTSGEATMDIRKMIHKFSFPDVSPSAQILYQTALEMIWFVTGMSPMALSGVQDKQIRVSSAADLVSEASLRSSSTLVQNVENGYMNPTTWDIAQIFDMYYDDFKFKERDLSKEDVKNLNNIRVVNGSFLPSDNMTRLNKLMSIMQMALQNPSVFELYDLQLAILESMDMADATLFLRSPDQTVSANEAKGIVELAQQGGPEAVIQQMIQIIQQSQEQNNVQA